MRRLVIRGRWATLPALLLGAATAQGQRHAADSAAARVEWGVGARAVGLVTRAAPAYDGRAFTEAYLSQPVVMGHLRFPRLGLAATGTLDFEGATLDRGELNAGIWGEGYVDRRHPHTLVHEAMLVAGERLDAVGAGAIAWSVGGGKGFVPFGSDDPMTRPLVKFPANHHLAQLLERWVALVGVRAGPLMVEAATFGGDEPVGPYRWPSLSRFGDSWAARATLEPRAGVELSASVADVESPEHRLGGGLDQRKWHAGVRVARGSDGTRYYLLAEAARTDDRDGARPAYRFDSRLVEGAVERGAWQLAGRFERSDRPEEERLLDPFRSPRPAGGNTIVGVTRWDIATLGLSRAVGGGPLALRPFAEAAYLRPSARVAGALFDPAAFYGARDQWSISAGLRVAWGTAHARMGRYGVAADGAAPARGGHDHASRPAAAAPPIRY